MRSLLVTLVSLTSLSLFAADGSSGCGPGWYVSKDNSLVSSSIRSTTNGMLMPTQTIGMTVGTSNCTKHSIVENEKEAMHMATMNFIEIKNDIAKGDGVFLNSFVQTLNCKHGTVNQVKSTLKNNFIQLYPTDEVNPVQFINSVEGSLKNICNNDLA
jgi:hypothetical protein